MKVWLKLNISLTCQCMYYHPMATDLSVLHKKDATDRWTFLISKYNCIVNIIDYQPRNLYLFVMSLYKMPETIN